MTQALQFSGKLTSSVLKELRNAGLEVEVTIDLSRNAFMPLQQCGRDIPMATDHRVATLRIHLSAGTCKVERYAALKSGWLNRKLSNFMRLIEQAGGFKTLQSDEVVVEATQFDSQIVDLRNPPMALSNAHQAATAPDADSFMALPQQIRCSMGIYRRDSAQRFTRLTAPMDPAPVAKN